MNLLYGDGFAISANLLRIFAGLSLVIIPSILLGYPLLAAMGYPRIVNYSTIIASGIHILLLLCILPVINVYLVAAVTIVTQIVVIGIRIFAVQKNLPAIRETGICGESPE